MLSVIRLVSKKSMIMHYMTALNASKKENDMNYCFEMFYVWAVNCDVTICQNRFVGMALFLAGGNKVRYFLDRPFINVV